MRRLLYGAHQRVPQAPGLDGFDACARRAARAHDAVLPHGGVVAARDEKILMPAHRATLLNNAARAHSEIWNPSTEMCLDGLAIRREVAEEIPIAASLNTLALIYDDLGRYEDAPLLSAKSIAYCRRARESRQLGFSLRQMAETLRHLADHETEHCLQIEALLS